ncbi:MAG: zinc ribbon domain-containing protein [Clostridia bacterium]|nr:zinc ribbon domain-containing protein [Clostridia bacterium]
MFCSKCGTPNDDNGMYCTSCGAPLHETQPTKTNATHTLGMKWFKWLIYFVLFAGALLNAVNGIQMLTGSMYDGYAETVYFIYPKLQNLDKFVGIVCLAIAAFGIYTRFRLAGYKKNGPMMLYILYISIIAIQLIYIIGVSSVLPEEISSSMDFSSVIGNMVASAVMIFVNISYFKKRRHLFVN